MLDVAWVILLAAWSARVGLRLLHALRSTPENPADALALAIPLGLGALALAVLGLGELGSLTVPGILGVLLVGVGFGARDALRAIVAARRRFVWRWEPGWHHLWDLALAATLLGTLLTALAPVTDGDALCYHLQVPKVFLAWHAVGFDPDLHETVYPLMTELLYAVALALRGPVACRLVQWLLGVVFALNVNALARPVLGEARARWAGTIALLAPAVSNGMGAPLNDVALAAFGTAAIVAWFRWSDRLSARAAVVSGAFAGLAMGVKYPALVLAGLLGLAMRARLVGLLWTWRRDANEQRAIDDSSGGPTSARPNGRGMIRARLKSGLLGSRGSHAALREATVCLAGYGLTAALVGGGWYLRAYFHTGNPVHPFFRQTFGGSGIDAVLDPIKRPMAVTPLNLLTALGPLTLEPDRFDSFSHQFGPAFLLFLPGLLLARPPRRVWAIVTLGYAFLLLCLTQRQSMRFVLIAVGPMAVGVAWLVGRWWDRRSVPARVLVLLVGLTLAFEATMAMARARHGLRVVLGSESAEAYLTRREPSYRVARWVAEFLPPDAHLVGQDHRGFYFPCAYTMELAHRRRTGLGARGESADALVRQFRSAGFTHLLLCPPEPEGSVEFDPTLTRRLAPWLARRAPLYQAAITDPDGVRRRYAIYALADETVAEQEWASAGQGRARR